MKKDAYYFPHYSNARHDRKVRRIIKDFGVEGYGIFFMLLEILREQTDFKYPLEDVDLLADEINVSEKKVRAIIANYGLFSTDDVYFFSCKLVFYLQPYIEKSERARLAANKRWAKVKKSNANALPEQSICNANQNASKVKESKVKESRVEEKKKKKEIPTYDIFEKFCIENCNDVDLVKLDLKYKSWVINGWKDGNDKAIKNWKSKILNTLPFLKKEKSSAKKESASEYEKIPKHSGGILNASRAK